MWKYNFLFFFSLENVFAILDGQVQTVINVSHIGPVLNKDQIAVLSQMIVFVLRLLTISYVIIQEPGVYQVLFINARLICKYVLQKFFNR